MKGNKMKHFSIANTILFVILVVYTIALITLLVWGVSTSLKTLDDFYDNKIWLPRGKITEWGWDNYGYVWENFAVELNSKGRRVSINIWGQLYNTILYTIGGALATTSCCCLMAYLTSKFDYAYSRIVYTVVIITMIIPIVGTTPSVLLLLKRTKLYDTWLGTYLMKFTFGGMYFLIFHGVFDGISPEYAEAATIDGASEYRIFFNIMLPLVKTTFYTVFLIQFIGYWNDYTMALMYMPTHPTLAYGVYKLGTTNMSGMSYAPMRMVACVILALPLMIIFIAFRDKLIGNSTMGGVKE